MKKFCNSVELLTLATTTALTLNFFTGSTGFLLNLGALVMAGRTLFLLKNDK